MSYGRLALKWSEPYLVVQYIFSRSKTQEKHLSGTLWTSPSIQEVWSHCKRDDPWTWREESHLQPGARGLSSSTCQIQYYPAVSCMPQGCVQKHRISVTGISSSCRQQGVFVPHLSFGHLQQSTNPKSLPPLRPGTGSGVCRNDYRVERIERGLFGWFALDRGWCDDLVCRCLLQITRQI